MIPSSAQDVENYLIQNKIKFKKEVTIRVLNNQRFDFYLPKFNTFIEYDGIQHFKPIDQFGGFDAFIDRRLKDKQKDIYCYENGYQLIRLSNQLTQDELIMTLNRELLLEEVIDVDVIDQQLPYFDEFFDLEIANRKELYVTELYKRYKKFIEAVLSHKADHIEIYYFEQKLLTKLDDVTDLGFRKTQFGYTRVYKNNTVDLNNETIPMKQYQSHCLDYFVNFIENIGLLDNEVIPGIQIYQLYLDWQKPIFSRNYELTSFEFHKILKKLLSEYGFIKSTDKKRAYHFLFNEFKPILHNFDDENGRQFPKYIASLNTLSPSTYYIKKEKD